MELKHFARTLREDCGIVSLEPLVVGVSGGPDSLCLLHLLHQLKAPMIIGHINHGLRAEADEETAMVVAECQKRGIPLFIQRVDIHAAAIESHQSIEEAGRKTRYQFLFQLAQEHSAQAVLVAHNADDQVETVLMHLLRGSGVSGLRGMDYRQLPNEWSNTTPLVRPLLEVTKQEILDYCRQEGLEPAFDRSNEDRTFFRNRLRLELLPYLQNYNPSIRQRLIHMADVLREEDKLLQQQALDVIKQALLASGDGCYLLDRERMAGLPMALLRRAFYLLMRELAVSTANIGFDSIDAATKFLEQPTRSGAITLVAGVRLMNYRKHALLLALESSNLEGLWPQLPWEDRPLKMAGELLALNGLWKFELLEKKTPLTDDPWCAVLDAEHIDALTLGRFQPGDRFSPLGMAGKSMKLGDYWTNEGLPVPARGNWPLLRCNEQIAWVPGFTINERFKVTKNTRKTISLRVFKAD